MQAQIFIDDRLVALLVFYVLYFLRIFLQLAVTAVIYFKKQLKFIKKIIRVRQINSKRFLKFLLNK